MSNDLSCQIFALDYVLEEFILNDSVLVSGIVDS